MNPILNVIQKQKNIMNIPLNISLPIEININKNKNKNKSKSNDIIGINMTDYLCNLYI